LGDVVDHVPRTRFLHGDTIDDQSLVQTLHRIAKELLGYDPGALRRKGVVTLAHEPVRGHAIATWWTAPAVGDIHRHHVAEHVVVRAVGGDVFASAAEDDGHLHFPLDAVTAKGHDDFIAVADNGAAGGFQEEVGHAPVLLTLADAAGQLVIVAAFAGVGIEVDGRVHDLAGILDGRHDVHRCHRVDEAALARAQQVLFHQPVDDLVDAVLEAIL